MKSIVTVNCSIPTVDGFSTYLSSDSLRDYDIAVFDPELPYVSREHFSAGGSCISISAYAELSKAMNHWAGELRQALQSGKTVFIILNEREQDSGATGSTLNNKTSRTFHTTTIDNYSPIPARGLGVRNSKGRRVVVKDSAFKGLHQAIGDSAEYRVILDEKAPLSVTFAAKDGTPVGGIVRSKEWPGSLVLLPFFDFNSEEFTATGEHDEQLWTQSALNRSRGIVSQLIAIDRMLTKAQQSTPTPNWVADQPASAAEKTIDQHIAAIDDRVAALQLEREEQLALKGQVAEYSGLLYETGKPLERAIEGALRVLGYAAETFREGDLEIDHVITAPNGLRMIGESEGKDNSAVDISKFRQLETNIAEDFEREDATVPAKGLLFGNGYRLRPPAEREEQFTAKCLTNAKRLGSALIRTADLYSVVIHLLDNPADEPFKLACRSAIEDTVGAVVEFPKH